MDEIYGAVVAVTTGDGQAASLLNKIFSNQPVKLQYKGASSISLRRVVSSFVGTIHPGYLMDLLKVWSSGNGYEDRWLVSCVDNEVADLSEKIEAMKTLTKPKFSFDLVLRSLAEYMKSLKDIEQFSFTEAACQLIVSLSKELKQRKIIQNEKIYREGVSGATSCFISKMEDVVQKMALLIHILTNSVNLCCMNNRIDIPRCITKETVSKAISFVQISATGLEEFSRACEDQAVRKIKPEGSTHIQLVPGKFVTCRLFNEKYGSRRTFKRHSDEEFRARIDELAAEGFGKVVEAVPSGYAKLTPVFFKIPPNDEDTVKFMEKNILLSEYSAAYKAAYALSDSKYKEMQKSLLEFGLLNPYNSDDSRGLKREIEGDCSDIVVEEPNIYD